MPLEFKSIPEKEAQYIADIEAATGQSVPTGDVQFDRINARSNAGMSKETDLSIVIAMRDVFLSTTQDEDNLDEFALYTKTERKQPTAAVINVIGTGTPSALIPGGFSGVTFVRDDGKKYYFANDFTVPLSGAIEEEITCMTTGTDGNMTRGTLNITAQNSNISSVLTVDESDPMPSPGTDGETFEQYRTAVKQNAQRPPLPDGASYYNRIARQRPNIIAAYMYADKPGQVSIYIESDSEDGVATAAQVADMDAWFRGDIDGIPKLNPGLMNYLPDGATPRFSVYPSNRTSFDIYVIDRDGGPSNIDTLIKTDMANWFKTRRPYIKGLSIDNTGTITNNMVRGVLQQTFDSAGGGTFSEVRFLLTSGGGYLTTYPLGRGERAYVDPSNVFFVSS